MQKLLATLLALVLPAAALAESAMHAGELAHALDRLGSTTRVLYVAAHPDDENTRLLAWLANGGHVRAAYLSLTRGGGGQNLIGTEQGELLDVVRTEELLAARRIDGAEQRFSRMRDFGFSKSPEETLAIWGHDEALADVVRVIRAFQPDVIVTRFDEVSRPNHGHHVASAILAREAFAAAADPQAFPEQIREGLQPWAATRLLHNESHWRGPPPADALPLDLGDFDPRLGMGYGELAALSRSQHKSQGFGAAGERGSLLEHFSHVAGIRPEKDILEGIEPGWARFGAAGKRVDEAVAAARAALDRDHPERAVRPLLAVRDALRALPDSVRRREALEETDRLIAAAAGIFLRATAPRALVTPGASVPVEVELIARLPAAVAVEAVTFPGGARQAIGTALGPNEKRILPGEARIDAAARPTQPYWLAQPAARGHYVVEDPALVGAPRGPAALEVEVALRVEGEPLTLRTPVVHAWTDRVHGERVRDVLVAPPATVTPMREAVMVRRGAQAEVVLRVRAATDGLAGEVVLDLPAGWSATPASQRVALAKAGEETTVHFRVGALDGAEGVVVRPAIVVDGRRWSFREDRIDYPHIPLQLVFQPASLRLQPVELELPEGLIGYVQGSGDSIANDLAHVGARVELIDDATLRAGDLDRYAAIVIGIRAYNARPAVAAAHRRLMEWVERGGTVVVQYVTTSRWDPLRVAIGPFDLEIGPYNRVTDERAKMTPVRADHPLLRSPHRITEADFEGWVQERGLYFAERWDDRYEPLFVTADPGEEPQRGATLVARHGKGRYVYTGLSFFRQLRAGVPGAYRLFLNFVAGK